MTSRSFMDAIKSVGRKSADLTEGAKDKTSDGMTPDAKHFAQDLHKVQDPGVKHLVQKDSESKDYEKMFKPEIEKFPTRPADMEPSQSVDKYVEYNEAIQMEAKKLSKKDDQKTGDNPDNEDATGPLTNENKKCGKNCTCEDCKTVAEIYVNPNNNTPAAAALRKSQSGPNASTLPTQAGQGPASPMRNQGASGKAKPPERAQQAATPVNKTRAMAATPSGTPTWGTQKKPSATGQMVQSVARDVRSQPGQGSKTVTSTSQVKPSGMSGNYTNKGGSSTNMAQATKAAGQMAVDRNKPKVSPTTGAGRPSTISTNTAQKPSAASMAKSQTSKMGGGGTMGSTSQQDAANQAKSQTSKMGGGGTMGSTSKTSTTQKFTSQNGLSAPKIGGAKPPAAKPQVAKPQVAKPQSPPAGVPRTGGTHNNDVGPSAKLRGGVTTGKTIIQQNKPRAKAPAGTNPLKSHYEIEWNGNSYLMNEAQIEALSVFIEKYGMIDETTAGEFIKKEMQHPEKLTAKGKKNKIKQSLAIYYSKKRHGENP
jgi:hypothetical protein